MENVLPIVLILVVFMLGFLLDKVRAKYFMKVVYAGLVIFLIVYALIYRGERFNTHLSLIILLLGVVLKNTKLFVPVVPVVFVASAVSFVVSALVSQVQFYINILGAILALVLAVQSAKTSGLLKKLRIQGNGGEIEGE